MHVQEMYRRLTGLVVFRRLLQDPVVAACGEMLSARVRGDSGDFSAACAGFEAALFQSSDSWSCYLREAVLESENVCIRGQAVGKTPVLRESLRREFSANVSHELKTPLTSISGFAELMKEGLVEADKMREFAGDIYKECGQLIALIDDIMKLSRLDEGSEELSAERVDLYDLSQKILQELTPVAAKRGISLHMEGGRQTIQGVWRILHEMIYNLCDNAIKYNKDGGAVTVRVTEEEDQVVVSVEDTGIGISEGQQDRVFERFYRVDKSHSRRVGGTGLGLSIVKHGAQYHNAQLSLDSEPGAGTTITLRFPKQSAA